MQYKKLMTRSVSLATTLSTFIVLELLIFAGIDSYWRSAHEVNIGGGLFLDGVIVLLSMTNITLFVIYIVRVFFKKSSFTPYPIILGLLCLWIGMLLFQ